MNPFESGVRKVIPAVLVYGRFEDQILMLHRNSRQKPLTSSLGRSINSPSVDFHEGKWNGLGGKCELDESPLEAVQREFAEESGLVIRSEKFKSLGVLQFPNFKPHKQEDWIVFVFTVKLEISDLTAGFQTEAFQDGIPSSEGTLHWVPSQNLLALNLWPGDRHFVPYVLKEKPFMGTLWYNSQGVVKYWIQGM